LGADRLYWARRIEVLIGFARYRQIFDPRTEIPPRHLFGPAHRRKAPYVYSCDQLQALVAAGCKMSPSNGLRPLTYTTLFGLLSCTGLRIGEALRLRVDDVDLKQGVIIVRESKRRSRLVPLHRSAIAPLRRYASGRTTWHEDPATTHQYIEADLTLKENRFTTFATIERKTLPVQTSAKSLTVF
jgi:integrase